MKQKLRPKERPFAPGRFWLILFSTMVVISCLVEVVDNDPDWFAHRWWRILATCLFATTFATLCFVLIDRRRR